MREIAERLRGWHAAGRAYAVASVVAVSGSAPREPGAALAVDADGEAVGSVSGGCVEGAVYELCREALETGRPGLHRFGWSDADAFAVGLTCGGEIDVFVQPVRPGADGDPGDGAPARDALGAALAAATGTGPGGGTALARVVAGPAELVGATLAVTPTGHHGSPLPAELSSGLLPAVRGMLALGRTGTLVLGPNGSPCPVDSPESVTVFTESWAPPPRLLVFGAIDFAAALCRVGRFLGYEVTVCDARPVFATARRFPDAARVVVDWPHRYLAAEAAAGRLDARTALCVLTHDAKFDVPLLACALRLPSPPAYVGAMGSRRTHRDRLARLRETGLTEAELTRLHSPIGLDLGARTPEETAISIAAELIAHRHGATGLPLTTLPGPIHRPAARATVAAGG